MQDITRLTSDEWKGKAQSHYDEIAHYAQPARKRQSRQEKHPVLDFLHTYYSYSWGNLEKWHPGLAYELVIDLLADELLPHYYTQQYYVLDADTLRLDPTKLSDERRDYFKYIRNLLVFTQARAAHYRCYGLHEWAMVYKADPDVVRHAQNTTLRLEQLEIDAVVESRDIFCTHFDAYRFFTPAAQPLNHLQPTLDTRMEHEQPACIHANMDLYKWAYKCMPWVGSDLLKKTFLLALKAREIDMRASPYELSSFGYEAIRVETAEGRAQYVQLQKELAQEGRILRGSLIEIIDHLLKI